MHERLFWYLKWPACYSKQKRKPVDDHIFRKNQNLLSKDAKIHTVTGWLGV
jgi:hypothetical protein